MLIIPDTGLKAVALIKTLRPEIGADIRAEYEAVMSKPANEPLLKSSHLYIWLFDMRPADRLGVTYIKITPAGLLIVAFASNTGPERLDILTDVIR